MSQGSNADTETMCDMGPCCFCITDEVQDLVVCPYCYKFQSHLSCLQNEVKKQKENDGEMNCHLCNMVVKPNEFIKPLDEKEVIPLILRLQKDFKLLKEEKMETDVVIHEQGLVVADCTSKIACLDTKVEEISQVCTSNTAGISDLGKTTQVGLQSVGIKLDVVGMRIDAVIARNSAPENNASGSGHQQFGNQACNERTNASSNNGQKFKAAKVTYSKSRRFDPKN